jgi:hypothetical protein
MKKLIFTLIISIGVLSVRASYLASDLSIRMWDNSLITVELDGQSYGSCASTFNLTNLSGGTHLLKVYRYNTNHFGQAYGLPRMVFNAYINIKPGTVVSAMITADFRYLVLSESNVIPAYTNNGNHGNWNNPGHHNGHGYGHDNDNGYGHHDDNYYNNNNNYNNNYNNGYYVPACMSSYDFMALKSTVANASFDDTRLSICKQVISASNVSSDQVYELMNLLTFESNKLDLAKFAYSRVVDKNRFYVVNNAFTFSSSVDELNRYISSY